MKKAISIILAAVMLAGCAKTPENVKSRVHRENSGNEVATEMIPPSDLQSAGEQALKNDYAQFNVGSVKLSLPSEVNEVEFTQASGFESGYEMVFDSLLGKDFWRGESVTKQTDTSEYGGMTTCSFRNESRKVYGCVGDNGFITFIKPDCFDDPYASQAETVRVYDTGSGERSGDKYRLADGDYSISETVDFANRWLKENYSVFEPDVTFWVKSVAVKKRGQEYCFSVGVQKLFGGVPLDDMAIIQSKDDYQKAQYIVSRIQLTIHRRADVSSFTNGTGIIIPNVKGKVLQLLSLQSVLELCRDKFTAYNEINLRSIALKYTIEPVYSPDDPYKSFNYAGKRFSSHIIWELLVDDRENKDKAPTKLKYIFVDAQTGEISFDFDGVTVEW